MIFERKISSEIEQYFKTDDAPILIIDGARQVGKSFIIHEIGTRYYKNYVEVNMIQDKEGSKIFQDVHTTKDLYFTLQALAGKPLGNYDDTLITRFCALLMERRSGKVFTTGEGFSNIVGTYIMHRLAICGFKAFNNVHFYDYMVFQEARHGTMRDEAAVMFAISQSGETEPVLNDVRHAKQHGHKIVTFTRRGDSTLAQLSDLVFVIDGAKQTLAGSLPNPFFGYVILTFENLMARYFDQNESV